MQLSKALSTLLRHKAEEYGMKIRSDGFISLDDVLEVDFIKALNPSKEMLWSVVGDNNKKRFELIPSEEYSEKWMIRAV